MLAKGYSFAELMGRNNPLTAELRNIEQIVGPVQSAYIGNIAKEDFNRFVAHLDFNMSEETLEQCINDIRKHMRALQALAIHEVITLEWCDSKTLSL
jgi:hypothetical protein